MGFIVHWLNDMYLNMMYYIRTT